MRMKFSCKKISIITNIILSLIVVAVACVSFIPSSAVTISGTGEYYAIYNGKRDSGGVCLTFNIYENTEVVNGILDELKKTNAKATFFVGGCWADDNAQTLKRIINEGHELGNHGYYHKDHKKLDKTGNFNEISNNHKIVYSLTGYTMKLFAPPSGSFNKTTLECAKSLGYDTIMWSKDTIDWRDDTVSLIVNRAVKNLTAGDIILMHPKTHTLKALPQILKSIEERNLKTLTISECARLNVEV